MIILRVTIQDVNNVMSVGMNQVNVYRDTSPTGSFTTQIGSFNLVQNQTYYEYTDQNGLATNYYELSYFNSSNSQETTKSQPTQGLNPTGPLGILTTTYVKAYTDFPEIANLPDSKVAEYITRAEGYAQQWFVRWGGMDNSIGNFGILMPIGLRLLLEQIYLYNSPDNRRKSAGPMISEQLGSYKYQLSKRADGMTAYTDYQIYLTPEIVSIFTTFINTNAPPNIIMKTTQMFPELKPTSSDPLTPQFPGVSVRGYADFLDVMLAYPDPFPMPWPYHDPNVVPV